MLMRIERIEKQKSNKAIESAMSQRDGQQQPESGVGVGGGVLTRC